MFIYCLSAIFYVKILYCISCVARSAPQMVELLLGIWNDFSAVIAHLLGIYWSIASPIATFHSGRFGDACLKCLAQLRSDNLLFERISWFNLYRMSLIIIWFVLRNIRSSWPWLIQFNVCITWACTRDPRLHAADIEASQWFMHIVACYFAQFLF